MPILSCPVPSNISTLNPNGFLFSIQKYPELNYFIQEAPLPSISLGEATMMSSVHDFKMPGEALEFEDITFSFLVDEKMENYLAIHDWMVGMGFPEDNKMYRDLMANSRNRQSYGDNSKAVSDCFLTILNSDNLPVKRFAFVDAFPKSLSGLTFQANNTDVQYLVAQVTMAYSFYTVT